MLLTLQVGDLVHARDVGVRVEEETKPLGASGRLLGRVLFLHPSDLGGPRLARAGLVRRLAFGWGLVQLGHRLPFHFVNLVLRQLGAEELA